MSVLESLGTSYNKDGIKGTFDTIVIGSGAGGLATAVILAKEQKQRVLVLEKHYTAGGYTHAFKRKGYKWDVGVHYIGDVGSPKAMGYKLYSYLSNGQMKWADMGEVYDQIHIGEEKFDFVKGKKAFIENLKSHFPEESKAIDQYIERVEEATKYSALYFAEKAVPPFVSTLFGGMMRSKMLKHSNRTTKEVMEELTSNKKLISVLTGQFGDYGLPPSQSSFAIHAMVNKHYWRGGYYPVGGATEIAKHAIPIIENAGGKVITMANVTSLLMEGNAVTGVELEDGFQIKAKTIISDAGIINTYKDLVPEGAKGRQDMLDELKAIGNSSAHLGLYIGLKHSEEELQLGKTNLWIYPENMDHEGNIERFRNDINAPFPLVYISFPSAKDTHWQENYPDRSMIEVITLGDYKQFSRWENTDWYKRGEDYEALKEKLAQRMLEVLYKYRPQVRGKIDHYELSTPLSTRNFANYQEGEIYGLEHSPRRYQSKMLKPKTPYKNFYLTGQDICSCGVAGAFSGAILTTSLLLGKNMFSKIAKS